MDARQIHEALHHAATGLQIFRIRKNRAGEEELIGYEQIDFPGGREAVGLTLIRAAISGRVDLTDENLPDWFADVKAAEGTVQCVALDGRSFNALKYKLRPRLLRRPTP